ncbi:MAG: TldD/PmbA family protein [Pleurocapsa sp.]
MSFIPSYLEQLLELSARHGASHSEVYRVTSQSRPISFEGNRLKQLESSSSEGTALRLWLDNRPGLAVAYGRVEPELLVEKAIALSQLNQAETIDLVNNKQIIYQGTEIPFERDKLIELGNKAIALLREEYPELICSAELEWERETTTLINSQGLQAHYSETSLSYDLGVELIRGDDFLGIYDGEYTKDEINLDVVIEGIIRRLDYAKYNATPLTGTIPVLFTANAATLLWDTVAAALNGKRIWEGSSPWCDRQQDIVTSELLTISQQPERQPYDCPFDDEGTSTQTLNLIERGRLLQFYSDRTIARELGIQATGNGFRPDLDSYPSPSLVNLIIEPGTASLSELITQLDNGIIIDQILGGGANISGDFSVNVDLGYRVENGAIIGRIKDTAIANNVYQLLNQIVALGNDSVWDGFCHTPSLIVSELSVVG